MTVLHLIRRGAWHVQDVLYAGAVAPALGVMWLTRHGGGGIAGAFGATAIAALVTCPIWIPLGGLGWSLGAVFRLGPIDDEIQREYNEKRAREAKKEERT